MAQIEGFRIKNYRALRDVQLGKLVHNWNDPTREPLTSLVAVIGKNGVGKTTLFDAFSFLADSLKNGVEYACNMRGRGGFERLVSAGQSEIEFEVYYRERAKSRPITYNLAIRNEGKRVVVASERFRQRREHQTMGSPFSFLRLENGKGDVWQGGSVDIDTDKGDKKSVEMTDKRRLAIATLGGLVEHPRIAKFRQFIENWYLSYFTPDAVRRAHPQAGPQQRLNTHGDNLGNVVQYLEREDPKCLGRVLDNIARKIPGIHKIRTEAMADGRLALQFNDKGFEDPFYAQQMSDGTLKMFSYLLLLEEPNPPPFICIEEPENGLYHKLLEGLAEEFRAAADKRKSQLFVTTHQPYFVNALNPKEVWVLEKGEDGFSKVKWAAADETVKALVEEEFPLGSLWYSDYLDG